jgi:hypothetical protein
LQLLPPYGQTAGEKYRRAGKAEEKNMASYTDKNENKIFLIYMEIQKGAVAKSYMTPHISLNICGFPHIIGSPSSYMTLQPLPSEFPYI